MKLSVDRDLLSKAVRRCMLPVSNTGNPALACVALYPQRIPDQPGGLDLKATNGLLGVATMIACRTESDADPVAINTKVLSTIVGTMPAGTLTLETKGDPASAKGVKLIVSSGQRRVERQARPVADVKPLPEPSDTVHFVRVKARELLTAFERVRFVVPDVGSEHTFRRGVFLDLLEGTLNAVVWGDHQLSHYEAPGKAPPEAWKALVPDMAVPYTRDVALEEEDGEITLSFDQHYVWVESSSTLLMFNPPPGEYLDWRLLLGKQTFMPVCRVPRLAMIESLKAMLAVSTSPVTSTWVRLLQTGELRFDYAAADGEAEFHDTLPVSDITATELPTFMVGAEYLLHAIDAANIDPILQFIVTGDHIALTTEEGYFWTGALTAPGAERQPPPLDGEERAPIPPNAPAKEEKKPRTGRQPKPSDTP